MRAAILTWGTRGDVQPMLALAQQLVAQGDEVVFGAPSLHGEFVRSRGLSFVPLGTPTTHEAYRAMMDSMHAEPNPRRQNRALLQKVLLADIDRLYADCLQAAAEADVVVSHWLQVGAGLAAEKLGKPWASVSLNAAGIECEQALAGDDERRLRENFSRWLWGDRLRQFRAAHGLREVSGTVAESVYSASLNFVAISRHLVPECGRWGPQHQAVGFFQADEPAGWQPEPRVTEFLARHGPALVVTLGSSAGAHIDQKLQTVLEAVAVTGRPAIVQGLLADAPEVSLPCPGRMLLVGEMPHGWLFRHARCVLHHGGAGTTAAVLRAGVPSVAIGNLFDQPYWGNLLAARGLAAPPIVETAFDAATVADRIDAAMRCTDACRRFAALMAEEQGAAAAARQLRHWIHSSASSALPALAC